MTLRTADETMLSVNRIYLSYGIPGLFTYAAVIYAQLSMRKVLNGSFVILFTITASVVSLFWFFLSWNKAIQNIASWLNTWITMRLPPEPFYKPIIDWIYDSSLIRFNIDYDFVKLYHSAEFSHFSFNSFTMRKMHVYSYLLSTALPLQDTQQITS